MKRISPALPPLATRSRIEFLLAFFASSMRAEMSAAPWTSCSPASVMTSPGFQALVGGGAVRCHLGDDGALEVLVDGVLGAKLVRHRGDRHAEHGDDGGCGLAGLASSPEAAAASFSPSSSRPNKADLEGLLLALAQHDDVDLFLGDRGRRHHARQFAHVPGDFPAVELEDHVALLDAGLRGGARGRPRRRARRVDFAEAPFGDVVGHPLDGDAEPTAPRLAVPVSCSIR